MTVFFLRVLVCALLVTLPFAAATFLTGKAEGALYSIFPLLAALPAGLLIGFVFAPVEGLAGYGGRSASLNWLVPLAGALVAGLLCAAYHYLYALTQLKSGIAAFGDFRVWGVIAVFAVLGAMLGGLWRGSAWLVRYFGWA